MADLPQLFQPTHLRARLFFNEEYEQLRENEEFKGFADLPDVLKDLKNVSRGLEGVNFQPGGCKVIYDANAKRFQKELNLVVKDIEDAWSRQETTLYFIYYAGHGIMKNNSTYAVLGHEKDKSKALFPLEQNLRAISRINGGYIVVVLACCREKFELRDVAGTPPMDEIRGDEQNLYITFGCPPNRSVPGATTISKAYFNVLKENANQMTGQVTIPDALMFWTIHGSEPLSLVSRPTQLEHLDWEPEEGAAAAGTTAAAQVLDEDAQQQLEAKKAELAEITRGNQELNTKNSVLAEFKETIYRIASEFYAKLPEELKDSSSGKQDGELHIANFKNASAQIRAQTWTFQKVVAQAAAQIREVQSPQPLVSGFPIVRSDLTYTIFQSPQKGNHGTGYCQQIQAWPQIENLVDRQDVDQMRITEISFSRWGSGDYDLSALRLTNKAGQTSQLFGQERHAWETKRLKTIPIASIIIYRKSDNAYMRGFKINYRNGESDVINSDNGTEAGTVTFETYDELVGITVASVSDSETKPRRIGFTLMRDNNSPSMVTEFPSLPAEFQYKPYLTQPMGHGFTSSYTWPAISSLQGRTDVANMKIKEITFSRWAENDQDLSGMKLKNKQDQQSELYGREKFAFESITLNEAAINSITVFKKNEDYMRGFRINYRDGTQQSVNSVTGVEVGIVNFKEGDVLVGLTMICSSESDKRPRQLGFTIARRVGNEYKFVATTPQGNDFSLSQTWPEKGTLANRQDVAEMRITSISYSRWGVKDSDFSGMKLQNSAGQTSDVLGLEKYAWESITLKPCPIQKIIVYKKDDAYLKGFRILYRNGMEQLVNDDGGLEAGTIEFEEFDELVGMTVQCTSQSERRPRRFGFTIMRNAGSNSHEDQEEEEVVEVMTFPETPQGFQYKVHQTKPEGNGFKFNQTWPAITDLNGQNGAQKKLTKIQFSRWAGNDYDLSGLILHNAQGQTSETMGKEKHAWEEKVLEQAPIEKILIVKKNDDYMRGFKIFYRNGKSQVINSETGTNVQVIRFEQGDELVGITLLNTSEEDRRPRQVGFSIMRNGRVHQTEPNGCGICKFTQSWPLPNTLLGRQDVAALRLQKISFSRWGASDFDIAGIKVTNASGQESGLLGMERHAWEHLNLQQKPILKVNIFKKNGSEAYMRGLQIIYRDGATDTVNSTDGERAGTVEFEEFDELVGMTLNVTTEGDKRPRRFGLTLMRNSTSNSVSYVEPTVEEPQEEVKAPANVQPIPQQVPAGFTYRVHRTKPEGNNFHFTQTWPPNEYFSRHIAEAGNLKLKEISFSKWGANDMDLSGIKMTNMLNESSELIGKERQPWASITLLPQSIEKIQIIKKNDDYMRGLIIFYRNQEKQVVNSDTGPVAETVTFEPGDELAGLTVVNSSQNDRRPRQISLSILRNGHIVQTKRSGCTISTFSQTWPLIPSLQSSLTNVGSKQIAKIYFSRWGQNDYDLAGIKMTNNQGEESGIIGMARHEWDSITLQQKPIQKINIYKKPGDGEAYMRGFEIFYHNGSSDTINSNNGDLAGTIQFEEYDEFVGLTMSVTSDSDRRPRRFGFSIMRNSASQSQSWTEPIQAVAPAQAAPAQAPAQQFNCENYRVFETIPVGNEFRREQVWPSIQTLQGNTNADQMRINKISFSRWANGDWDLSAVKVTNAANQESDVLGKTRHEYQSVAIPADPIQKITVYKKNEEYIRGFRIYFRNGSSELINSAEGSEAGTIDFQENDVLVGITVISLSDGDTKPRQFRFSVLRDGQIHQTATKGHDFHLLQTWPQISNLEGRRDVEQMQIKEISFSRWGDTDFDFAGCKLTNNAGQSSDMLGMSRHAIQNVTLHRQAISNIKVFRKESDGYMRGFKITYRNGEEDLINSCTGPCAGTIDFEEGDVLVGLTIQSNSDSDKRPRRFGFTIMRNATSGSFQHQAAVKAAAASSLQRQGSISVEGVRESEPIGNDFRLPQVFPTIQSLQGRTDVNNMKLKTIHFSRWASGDHDLSGLKVVNNQNQTSDVMGTTRYEYESINLQQTPIQKIVVIKKNEDYLRGFKIHYRNGQTDLINSEQGQEAGTITFQEGDELVGLTCVCMGNNDKKPRRFGFTVLRNGSIHEYPPVGHNFDFVQTWPATSNLLGRDAASMRIKKIEWSRWAENDHDFAGVKLTNNIGQSSDLLGMQKYAIQSITLKQQPIANIKVFRKENDGYMRGFLITYRNGEKDQINSISGPEAGTIEFQQNEQLVGITLHCNSDGDRRPRRFGFTIMQGSAQSQSAAASSQPVGDARGWVIHETKPVGNEFSLNQTWPEVASLSGRRDVDNLRIKQISFSRWASGDHDFSGLKIKNNQDQESELMGTARFEFQSIVLQYTPIQKIVVYQKNAEYLRGFKIFYRNGSTDLINSADGPECGTIDFQENDVLIGVTAMSLSENDKKPRRFGFTVMRGGQVHQYEPVGHQFNYLESWPVKQTLQGRSDVETMRIKEIQWSRWGDNDVDFAGIKLTNYAGGSSEVIGMNRHALQSVTLKALPIAKIQVYGKDSGSYMRGFRITYRDGQTDLVNSDTGPLTGTIDFQTNDELVGITLACNSQSDKRPRMFGFTIMRNPNTAAAPFPAEAVAASAPAEQPSKPPPVAAGEFFVHETKDLGNEFSLNQTWPEVQTLRGRNDIDNMRLRQIQFSRWAQNDKDFSGLIVSNNSEQESELMGTKRHDYESVYLQQSPIQKIVVYKKNEEYLRGFKIHYRNGSSDLINSAEGSEAGTIDFEDGDFLVGITCLCISLQDKKPRRFGFTVIRNGQVHQYEPIGHNFTYPQAWPIPDSLQGNQEIASKRIKEISWSRWGENDVDFAGIKLTNYAGESSETLGMSRHPLQSIRLKQDPITSIKVIGKDSQGYMRGFKITYSNGQTDLIGSESGVDCGTIDFLDTDVLVGIKMLCNSDSDKRPRRFGFTIMRNKATAAQHNLPTSAAAAASAVPSKPPPVADGEFMVHETKPIGNDFGLEQTWPAISSLQGRTDIDDMRLQVIQFSRWGENDQDFSGLVVTNNAGQSSDLMGTKRHEYTQIYLNQAPIQKVVVYKKNEEYLRGFKIVYRDGNADLINSSQGPMAGTIEFQDGDFLIGITCMCLSDSDKKPRMFGFTVMRNGQVHRYAPVGHDFKHLEVWPQISSLQGNSNVATMRLREISWSRWGENDVDFAGVKLSNYAGQSSELLGMQKFAIQSKTLKTHPIKKIIVYRKDSNAYMRGFKIVYKNGQDDVIGSDSGIEAGTVEFEENDVLVGMTLQCNSETDKRPRRFGFTVMRNYSELMSVISGESKKRAPAQRGKKTLGQRDAVTGTMSNTSINTAQEQAATPQPMMQPSPQAQQQQPPNTREVEQTTGKSSSCCTIM